MLRAARRWVLTTLLILVSLVAGCSYDPVEPGLFGRPVIQDATALPIHRAATEERQVQNAADGARLVSDATSRTRLKA